MDNVVFLEAQLIFAIGRVIIQALAVLGVKAVPKLYGDWSWFGSSLYCEVGWRGWWKGETWEEELNSEEQPPDHSTKRYQDTNSYQRVQPQGPYVDCNLLLLLAWPD